MWRPHVQITQEVQLRKQFKRIPDKMIHSYSFFVCHAYDTTFKVSKSILNMHK
jgi:hypothetical protein